MEGCWTAFEQLVYTRALTQSRTFIDSVKSWVWSQLQKSRANQAEDRGNNVGICVNCHLVANVQICLKTSDRLQKNASKFCVYELGCKHMWGSLR